MNYLQGFKLFFEENIQPVNGLSELNRLEENYKLFYIKTNHLMANSLMNSRIKPTNFIPLFMSEINPKISELNQTDDTLLILAFPNRWIQRLGRGIDVQKVFEQMIKESEAAGNYIWGIFSLWNPRIEDYDKGNFYRNSWYHAHDGMLNKWIEKHPVPVLQKPSIPLNRAPRLMGDGLRDQGHHSFHGYNTHGDE